MLWILADSFMFYFAGKYERRCNGVGHETTAYSINFALRCLAVHQDVQNKASEDMSMVDCTEKNLKQSAGLAFEILFSTINHRNVLIV